MQLLVPKLVKGRGWIVRWREPVTGQSAKNWPRKQIGPFRTREEAEAAATIERARLRTGATNEPTFAELAERYLDLHDASTATINRLRWGIGKALPTFGHLRSSQVTPDELNAWRMQQRAGSRWDAFQAVSQMLRQSHARGIIPTNPAATVKNKRTEKANEVRPFTWPEIATLAEELGPKRGPLVTFATATGLRPGEWIALEHGDLHLNAATPFMVITRAAKSDGTVGNTKTKRSRRVILSDRALAALAATPRQLRTPLVFPAPRGGRINLHNWREDYWNPAMRAAGFVTHEDKPDRTPYALRHTYATNYLRMPGANTLALARRMGTSVAMIDKTYGHLAHDADAYERQMVNAADSEDGRMVDREPSEGQA